MVYSTPSLLAFSKQNKSYLNGKSVVLWCVVDYFLVYFLRIYRRYYYIFFGIESFRNYPEANFLKIYEPHVLYRLTRIKVPAKHIKHL